MKAYWKIPKEWVQEWGLSPAEALVLSDIQDWPNCSHEERAKRVGLSTRQLTRLKDKMSSNERTKCLVSKGQNVFSLQDKMSSKTDERTRQNVLKNRTKCPQIKKEKESSPTPPIKKNKNNQEQEELGLTIVSPAETSSAPEKKSQQKKEKKYTPEESKLHGELKAIFDEEWVSAFGDSFYWDGAEMAGLVKMKKQIQFKMKSNECDPNDAEQIKINFRFFIHKILTSLDNWTKENSSPKTIAGRFNVIYNQLKKGSNGNNKSNNKSGISDDYIKRKMQEAGLL